MKIKSLLSLIFSLCILILYGQDKTSQTNNYQTIISRDSLFSIQFSNPPTLNYMLSNSDTLYYYILKQPDGVQYHIEWRKRNKKDSPKSNYEREKRSLEYGSLSKVGNCTTKRVNRTKVSRFYSHGKGEHLFFMLVFSKTHFFRIVVSNEKMKDISKNKNLFFNSFKLLKKR
jgi:hypothetical protein